MIAQPTPWMNTDHSSHPMNDCRYSARKSLMRRKQVTALTVSSHSVSTLNDTLKHRGGHGYAASAAGSMRQTAIDTRQLSYSTQHSTV